MEDFKNEEWLQGMKEEFYEAIEEEDVLEAQEIIKELKEHGISTLVLEKDLLELENDLKSIEGPKDEPDDFSNSTPETYGL